MKTTVPKISSSAATNITTTRNTDSTVKSTIINPTQDKKNKVFLSTVNEVLGKPYLLTNVELKDDGNYYLVITRPDYDRDRPNKEAYDNIAMDNFKRSLGLRKHVIKNCKYNDSYAITKRRVWSDNATMEKGSSLYIPLNELGQEWYLIGGGDNKLLKQAVQEYLKK